MAEINTVIAEASQDLQTIEDFVNLPAGSDVRPRLLPSVNVGTLAGTRDAIFEAGGLPATPFATKALMTASALVDGDYAQVTDDTVNNGLYVKTAGAWVNSAYDPVGAARTYTDSFATVKSKAIARETDFNTITTEGLYRVTSNSDAASMINCPSNRAGVLEVLSVSEGLLVQRYNPYGIDKNVYKRGRNAGEWNVWDELLIKSVADAIYATKLYTDDAVSSSSSTTINALTQNDYYGKKYTMSEQVGETIYSSGVVVGYNTTLSEDVIFNSLDARIFNDTVSEIEYRIYTNAKLTQASSGWAIYGRKNLDFPDLSGICTSFPQVDTGLPQRILLDNTISLPNGTNFVIVFKAKDLTKFSIANHSSVSGNLEDRGFSLSQVSVDWDAQPSIANHPSIQAGFKLLVTLPASGKDIDEANEYKPELVIPPVIYTMSGLQAHIYPEHLTPEPHDLYLHDVDCTKGKQTVRGWQYDVPTGTAASTAALTWTLADKQTGNTITSASTSVVTADPTRAGNKNVMVIGDSYVNAGAITQRLLDISTTDPLKVTLFGTRGAGDNKHEGRGGWTVASYATAGRNDYKFTVTGVTNAPAINSTTYSYDGRTYLVQEVSLSGGAGYIIASLYGGSSPTTLGVSGTLTKANTGVGDTTVTFSNIVAVPANPFWINSEINFGQYLTNNSLSVPDIVLIQLGVNDSFGNTTDNDVVTLTTTAFAQLDTLIASIKAANPSVKVGIVAPPTYANQDAFGISYGTNQTAWRAKRNIVLWNKDLYAYYKDKEAQNIYVVAAGVNVDTQANFPTITQPTNSHNSTVITTQSNAVHPSTSGYNQIGDSMFAFIKAVS